MRKNLGPNVNFITIVMVDVWINKYDSDMLKIFADIFGCLIFLFLVDENPQHHKMSYRPTLILIYWNRLTQPTYSATSIFVWALYKF